MFHFGSWNDRGGKNAALPRPPPSRSNLSPEKPPNKAMFVSPRQLFPWLNCSCASEETATENYRPVDSSRTFLSWPSRRGGEGCSSSLHSVTIETSTNFCGTGQRGWWWWWSNSKQKRWRGQIVRVKTCSKGPILLFCQCGANVHPPMATAASCSEGQPRGLLCGNNYFLTQVGTGWVIRPTETYTR